jgi:hypothetical protein
MESDVVFATGFLLFLDFPEGLLCFGSGNDIINGHDAKVPEDDTKNNGIRPKPKRSAGSWVAGQYEVGDELNDSH